MGELTVSVSLHIEGDSQDLRVSVSLCANLRCAKSPSGGRRYFVPVRANHKYCDKECKDQWTNKTKERRIR